MWKLPFATRYCRVYQVGFNDLWDLCWQEREFHWQHGVACQLLRSRSMWIDWWGCDYPPVIYSGSHGHSDGEGIVWRPFSTPLPEGTWYRPPGWGLGEQDEFPAPPHGAPWHWQRGGFQWAAANWMPEKDIGILVLWCFQAQLFPNKITNMTCVPCAEFHWLFLSLRSLEVGAIPPASTCVVRYLVRLLNTCEKLTDSARKKLESRQQSAISGGDGELWMVSHGESWKKTPQVWAKKWFYSWATSVYTISLMVIYDLLGSQVALKGDKCLGSGIIWLSGLPCWTVARQPPMTNSGEKMMIQTDIPTIHQHLAMPGGTIRIVVEWYKPLWIHGDSHQSCHSPIGDVSGLVNVLGIGFTSPKQISGDYIRHSRGMWNIGTFPSSYGGFLSHRVYPQIFHPSTIKELAIFLG